MRTNMQRLLAISLATIVLFTLIPTTTLSEEAVPECADSVVVQPAVEVTATPAPTKAPTAAPTAVPTDAPTPTVPPTAAPTAEATPTEPTATAAPTTPEPTETVQQGNDTPASPADAPTAEPVNSASPEPAETAPVVEDITPIKHEYLTFQKYGDGLAVTGCDEDRKTVVVPSEWNGKAVLAIAEDAFQDCLKLTGVEIREGVLTIGKNAFQGCVELTDVALPASLTEIDPSAFQDCAKLCHFMVPDEPENSYAALFAAAWLSAHPVEEPAETASPSPEPTATPETGETQPPEAIEPSASEATPEPTETADAGEAAENTPASETVAPPEETPVPAVEAETEAFIGDVLPGDDIAPDAIMPEVEEPQAGIFITGDHDLGSGRSATLTAVVSSDGTIDENTIVWSTSDPAYVSLTNRGKYATVKAISSIETRTEVEITATLTSTSTPVSATFALSLFPSARGILLTANKTALNIDDPEDTLIVTAGVYPAEASQQVTWKTSNAARATVDENGTVSVGSQTGTVRITATTTDGSKKYKSITISVLKTTTGITLSGVSKAAVGKYVYLSAACEPADAKDQKLVWTSSDSGIAKAYSGGKVKGIAEGSTTITATNYYNNAIFATWDITVTPAVGSVSITTAENNVDLNSAETTLQLSATVHSTNGNEVNEPELAWTSSRQSVATVDENGLVTAHQTGTATVTVKALDGSGKYAKKTVYVVCGIDEITISGAASVAYGKTIYLKAIKTPLEAMGISLRWESSNTSIAQVYSSGKVKGIAKGTATITVTATDQTGKQVIDTHNISVTPAVGSVSITTAENKVDLNSAETTLQLSTAVRSTNGDEVSEPELAWTSSRQSVATVNENGLVTANQTGTTTITVKALDGSGKYAKKTVYVVCGINEITISAAASVAYGKTIYLKAIKTPLEATGVSLRWESSNTSIAQVYSNGKVKGIAEGTATITVTATDQTGKQVTDTWDITVKSPATSVQINAPQDYINLNTNAELALSASVIPENASQDITWTSSNTSIATIDENGLVTAYKAGKVTLYAKANDGSGKYAKVGIYVRSAASSLNVSGAEEVTCGNSVQLTADILPSEASQSVRWSSSNESTATVNGNGVVTTRPVEADTSVTITATAVDDPTITGNATLTVHPYATQITIIPEDRYVIAYDTGNNTLQLIAECEPVQAAPSVVWQSSNSSVATVNETGLVTAHSAGYATITATAVDGSGVSAWKLIRVAQGATGIEITGAKNLGAGCSTVLQATVRPAHALQYVSWYSSNENVATVDMSTGTVTAAEGITTAQTVVITAVCDENETLSDTHTITVRPAAQSIAISPGTIHYIDFTQADKTLQLTTTATPAEALQSFIWISDNESVATVDGNGKVTALSTGIVSITASTIDGSALSATATVKSVLPITQVEIMNVDHLIGGSTVQLHATTFPENASDNTILWSLDSGDEYASLSPDGLLTVKQITSQAIITIRATAASKSSVFNLLNILLYPETTSISLSENLVYINLNDTTSYSPEITIAPEGAYSRYKFSVSDSSVASIDESGQLTALLPGVLTLHVDAMDGSGLFAEAEVHVERPDYSYSEAIGGVCLTAYLGDDSIVEIPSVVMGEHVTALAECLFSNNETIITVSIPTGITAISNECFSHCINLEQVTIPDTVTILCDDAFNGCTSLRNLIFEY